MHRNLEFAWRIIAFLLFLAASATGPPCDAAPLRTGTTLPSVQFPSLRNSALRLPEGIAGKVAIIHFWTIGCSSCKEEMPAMDALYRALRPKGLEVVAVNVGQSRREVERFVQGMAISYPVLVDLDKKSAGSLEVTGVPRTIIVDRRGAIRYKIIGGASADLLRRYVMSLIES